MPGTDPAEAAAMIAGELPDLPHLVELPARGAGADFVGRTAAILLDLPVEVTPTGWRLTRRPGRDLRRAKDFLAWDLDAAQQQLAGAAWVKIQVAGPWSMAANVETPRGHRALLDQGALADLAASLGEGLVAHVADLSRRLPGTGIAVQVDEPSLPAVLAGRLTTVSGLGTVPPVDETAALDTLAVVTRGLGDAPTVAHCSHPDIPVGLLRRAGFGALSLDLASIDDSPARLDPIGEAVEAGTVLLAGLVAAHDPAVRAGSSDVPTEPEERPRGAEDARPGGRYDFHAVAAPLFELWGKLGLPAGQLAQVVVTPVRGLAGSTPSWARRALTLARDAARLVHERSAGG